MRQQQAAARVILPVAEPARPQARLDVAARYPEIRRLAAAYYRLPATQEHLRAAVRAGKAGRRLELEDFQQEVSLLAWRKTETGGTSAFNPARASFGKWVWQLCFSVASHATDRRESEALFSTAETVESVVEVETTERPAAERAAIEAAKPALRALAKAVEADRATGQTRLFALVDELPALANVLER